MTGQLILEQKIEDLTEEVLLDVQDWIAGNYFIQLTNGKENLLKKVIIVNE